MFANIQDFLTFFVPGYVVITIIRFFYKDESSSFEGVAVASVAISYMLNLIVGLFVEAKNNLLIYELASIILAVVCAIFVVRIRTTGILKNSLIWIGKMSGNDDIWQELFDRNNGADIRCYSKFNHKIAMIMGKVKSYAVRENGSCDIVIYDYTVTYEGGDQYNPNKETCGYTPILYLYSEDIYGLEVRTGDRSQVMAD